MTFDSFFVALFPTIMNFVRMMFTETKGNVDETRTAIISHMDVVLANRVKRDAELRTKHGG